MFLNQALTQLKNLKSKAARTDGYINASATYYEDETPEYEYAAELANREKLNKEILLLKTRIQITNATTTVKYKGEIITLTELILRNAQLRAEMAFITKQMEHKVTEDLSWRAQGRKVDDIKKVLAKGCDKKTFKARLDELERDKEELEAVMATANASTTLV